MMKVTRRTFLAGLAGAPVLSTVAGQATAAGVETSGVAMRAGGEPQMTTPSVCIFSKHLHFLSYEELARECKVLTLDGVDLTVRKGGHVEPDRVATDLPRAVEAVRREGPDVPMITTNLNRAEDPDARPILETAARLGIRYFRCGGLKYEGDQNPIDQLPAFARQLRDLAVLAQEFDMIAGYHNHSGLANVGAPLWDLYRLIELIGLESFGSNFDVGHAFVEGGLGAWEINTRLLAPHVKMMAVKDFVWENNRVRWTTLGQGHVRLAECLRIIQRSGFAGPISLHFEYKTPTREALFDEIRSAAATLRQAMAEGGFAIRSPIKVST